MKKNESGRSMVEMLGVLALVGILSMTGIYGYVLTMRKYRINEIVHVASILASEAQAANNGAGECLELSNSNLPATPGGVNLIMVADNTVEGAPVSIYIQMNAKDANALCSSVEQAFSGLEYDVDCMSSGITRCSEL